MRWLQNRRTWLIFSQIVTEEADPTKIKTHTARLIMSQWANTSSGDKVSTVYGVYAGSNTGDCILFTSWYLVFDHIFFFCFHSVRSDEVITCIDILSTKETWSATLVFRDLNQAKKRDLCYFGKMNKVRCNRVNQEGVAIQIPESKITNNSDRWKGCESGRVIATTIICSNGQAKQTINYFYGANGGHDNIWNYFWSKMYRAIWYGGNQEGVQSKW